MIEGACIRLNGWQQAAVAVGSAVGALLDPRRADLIAALGETTGRPTFERVLERMKKSPEGRAILLERPTRNLRMWATLGIFHPTLLGLRMQSSWDLGTSPQMIGLQFDSWTRKSLRMWPCVIEKSMTSGTLFNLPTNLMGESALKVIEFLQMLLPMCFLSVIGGSARFSPKQSSLFYEHYFPWAICAGMSSADLMCIYYERHFHEDLDVVRKRWGIKPAPPPPKSNASQAS